MLAAKPAAPSDAQVWRLRGLNNEEWRLEVYTQRGSEWYMVNTRERVISMNINGSNNEYQSRVPLGRRSFQEYKNWFIEKTLKSVENLYSR